MKNLLIFVKIIKKNKSKKHKKDKNRHNSKENRKVEKSKKNINNENDEKINSDNNDGGNNSDNIIYNNTNNIYINKDLYYYFFNMKNIPITMVDSINILGDEYCFMKSVAFFVYKDETEHLRCRNEIANYKLAKI